MPQTLYIPPLDPNAFTGPVRIMSGVARMGNVTLDTAYGEFARWLYVSTTGNVTVLKWDGTSQLLTGLVAGIFHPIYSIQIASSGTTATGIVWGS